MLPLIVSLFCFTLFCLLVMLSLIGFLNTTRQPVNQLFFGLGLSLSLIPLTTVVALMYRHVGRMVNPRVLYLVYFLCLLVGGMILLRLVSDPVNQPARKYMIMKIDIQDMIKKIPRGRSEHILLFRVVSSIYLLGALSNVAFYFVFDVNLLFSIVMSLFLVALGLILWLVTIAPMTREQEINLVTIVLALTIPLLLLSFLRDYGSDVVWPLSIVFILIPIIYNSRIMYRWVISVSTIVLLLSWVLLPSSEIPLSYLSDFSKMIVYMMCIILAGYINRSYIRKLHKIRHQIQLNKVLSEISIEFINVTEETLDQLSQKLLEKVGGCIDADRAYIVIVEGDGEQLEVRYEWDSGEEVSLGSSIGDIDINMLGWFEETFMRGGQISISAVDELPLFAGAEKVYMNQYAIQSLFCMPIVIEEQVIGFVGFDQKVSHRKRHVLNDELLKIVPNILADAMVKIESEKDLNTLAYVDGLTGLPNRVSLVKALDQALIEADERKKKFGIVFLDLDGFKTINDSIGHNWGDELLRQVSNRLLSITLANSFLGRFGGDEFILIVKNVMGQEVLERKVNQLISLFDAPFTLGVQDYHITMSAGVVTYPENSGDGTMLMQYADIALYEAKRRGKNRYIFYSQEINNNALRTMNITNSLYNAVDNEEMYLMYQPQVCLTTGAIIGYEALARWEHPIYGNIPPNVFIPIAEETGLIHEIGTWIMNQACQQNKSWQDQGYPPVVMAVNISIEQFRNQTLVDMIRLALETSRLEGKYLEIEITESIAMKASLDTIQCLTALRAIGLSISIDDFGTEYSSFKRLRQLPIDRLKIDMQFIKGIGKEHKDEAIINTLIYLGKSLGMKVIAEGVEEEAQREFLIEEECDDVQGYFYYKPLLPATINASIYDEYTSKMSICIEP